MNNCNNISFTNFPNCFDITVIKGENVYHKFSSHFHNSYNIGILHSGEINFKIDKINKIIKKNTIYLINPGSIHSLECLENKSISYTVINFKANVLYEIFKKEHIIFPDLFIIDTVKTKKILNYLDCILNKKTCSLEKQENFMNILYEFQIDSNEKAIVEKVNIERSKKYIHENFNSKINLTDLSNLSCLSMFHFIREFKKYTGLSPFEYIIQLRIKKSQISLLASKDIAETALEFGFYDQSHFTKYFKKQVGISPKKYIESYKIEFK